MVPMARRRHQSALGQIGLGQDLNTSSCFHRMGLVQHRLPIKKRLNWFIPPTDLHCILCNNVEEDDTHLFTDCPYAIEVWNSLMHWWPFPSRTTHADMIASLTRYSAPRAQKQVTYAIYAAAIYFIWYARNQTPF